MALKAVVMSRFLSLAIIQVLVELRGYTLYSFGIAFLLVNEKCGLQSGWLWSRSKMWQNSNLMTYSMRDLNTISLIISINCL